MLNQMQSSFYRDFLYYPVPSSSPETVDCTATSSTSIFAQWSPVGCIHRNSEIAYYRLRVTTDKTAVYVNSNDLEKEVTGLTPYTNYSIEVAAVKTLALLVKV